MRRILAITAALILSATAWAGDSQALPGFGTITWKTERSGKSVRLIATATNESGDSFRYVRLCVQDVNAKANTKEKNCAGLIERREIWRPEKSFTWDENLPRPAKSGAYKIVFSPLSSKAEPIDLVRLIYVDEIVGTEDKDMVRDQLKALIITTRIFKLAECDNFAVDELEACKNSADAILAGRAETRAVGSAVENSGLTTTSGGALATRLAAIGGSVSSGTSQGSTKTIFDKGLILRLTLPNGEDIWAWDDSKDCAASQSKAKCAIDDLLESTAHSPMPPIR